MLFLSESLWGHFADCYSRGWLILWLGAEVGLSAFYSVTIQLMLMGPISVGKSLQKSNSQSQTLDSLTRGSSEHFSPSISRTNSTYQPILPIRYTRQLKLTKLFNSKWILTDLHASSLCTFVALLGKYLMILRDMCMTINGAYKTESHLKSTRNRAECLIRLCLKANSQEKAQLVKFSHQQYKLPGKDNEHLIPLKVWTLKFLFKERASSESRKKTGDRRWIIARLAEYIAVFFIRKSNFFPFFLIL